MKDFKLIIVTGMSGAGKNACMPQFGGFGLFLRG